MELKRLPRKQKKQLKKQSWSAWSMFLFDRRIRKVRKIFADSFSKHFGNGLETTIYIPSIDPIKINNHGKDTI